MANVPIVTDLTFAELEILIAANGLEEGLQYKITDKGWLLTATSASTYIKSYGVDETNIKAFHVTFPIIAAGERIVTQFNIGTLVNRDRCLLGFCLHEQSGSELPNIVSGFVGPSSPESNYNVLTGKQKIFTEKFLSDNFAFRLTDVMLANMLIVSSDYTKIKRMVIPLGVSSGSAEMYDAASVLPAGSTYDEIGIGVIAGWYAYNSMNILFAKKVQIESVWLTQSGNDSILNFALKNVDSTSTVAKVVTIAIYE